MDLVLGKTEVPVTWIMPPGAERIPVVLLLHGLSSNKERMSSSVGRVLASRGIGSMAIDLPMHGERSAGNPRDMLSNPLGLVGAWRSAVREVRDVITWLVDQPSVDASRIAVLGYSLGGFLALMAAADDERLRVVALAAAGDLPDATPYASMVRALVDPPRAARKLRGRPLLLVNGRWDTTTRPAQAERLFAAADEPKTMLWYDGGHWPPAACLNDAADWLQSELDLLANDADSGRRTS
jgi:Dienelactone hydrolase and related enzymes